MELSLSKLSQGTETFNKNPKHRSGDILLNTLGGRGINPIIDHIELYCSGSRKQDFSFLAFVRGRTPTSISDLSSTYGHFSHCTDICICTLLIFLFMSCVFLLCVAKKPPINMYI